MAVERSRMIRFKSCANTFIYLHQECWILATGNSTSVANPWTSYVNDDGQVLYKVETPFKFFGLVSTIKSAVPGYVPAPGSSNINRPPPYELISDDEVQSDAGYRGEEYETSKFFTKKGLGCFGRHRAFTGPDGLEYQWTLGFRVPELVRRDAARTPVARFHRRRLGIFSKARRASLEIFPEGMHMVDLILVTFVYAQKIRNDGERASRNQVYTSY